MTAEKIIRAADILSMEIENASLTDFKNLLLLEADMPVGADETSQLLNEGYCELALSKKIALTAKGRKLIQSMGLTPKPTKRIKVTGNDASELIDKIFGELQ